MDHHLGAHGADEETTEERSVPGVSIYFFAGDFVQAFENHRDGAPQAYATHGEVMRLTEDLRASGHPVRIVSFVTSGRRDVEVDDGLRISELGATGPTSSDLLGPTVSVDDAEFVVPHFPNTELLRAAMSTDARLFAMLASSWTSGGPRTRWEARRIVRLLRRDRIEWVANHCRPAAEHLADLGVPRAKLLAWDVPHGDGPDGVASAPPGPGETWTVFYAGAITAPKGVGDLVDALGRLASQGRRVRLVAAGGGDTDEMVERAGRVGLGGSLELLGPVTNDVVRAQMRAADIVAVPSRHEFPEGMPLTLFEAVASGTPLVCSDHPMFVRDFVDGRSASTFRAGDSVALASAIARVMDDPILFERLSAAAVGTWANMTRTADMRTMLTRWVVDEAPSAWVAQRTLATRDPGASAVPDA
jgi:glycosyltransferase involved in cell wall biosynthesis